MLDPLSFGLIYGGYWLSKKLNSSQQRQSTSVPECRACSKPAVNSTGCCHVPLCQDCLNTWMKDPNPCPCKQH
jgi:hypothetical protein